VSGPQFIGFARRMKRIGKQQQPINETGFRCGQHRSLSSTIGMTAQEEAAGGLLPHAGYGGA
jgi:hypothetical protein